MLGSYDEFKKISKIYDAQEVVFTCSVWCKIEGVAGIPCCRLQRIYGYFPTKRAVHLLVGLLRARFENRFVFPKSEFGKFAWECFQEELNQ